MRKMLSLALVALLFATAACDDETPTPTPPPSSQNPDPTDPDPDVAEVIELSGDLDTQTLTADNQYLLKGQVFVREGKVLTVEPGTVVFGDKRTRATLIIDKGGKIEAIGTVDNPIVFTSAQEPGVRDRGDWGGIVMLGRANVNQVNPSVEGITPAVHFGTNNSTAHDNESSGTLEYVRIEFGGIELTPNNETNSLTMGAVGRGTKLEHVMVSFGGDDGFEWFGGTVNGKYLISHAMWDDDFDCDYGWSGNVQYGLVVRYPGFADQSQSNAFECDNGPDDNDVQPYTTGTFSNVTVYGPIAQGNRVSNGNYAHAIDLRRRTAISITNSVFTGFPTGLRMNQPSVLNNYQQGVGVIDNNVLVAPGKAFAAGSGVEVDAVEAYITERNELIAGDASASRHEELGLKQDNFYGSRVTDQYPANPDFSISSSGTLSSGAKFEHAKFSEENRTGFFDKDVQFIGGFGAEDWTKGWADFAPVITEY